jgi:DNA-binding XRE family transcriptional regulator
MSPKGPSRSKDRIGRARYDGLVPFNHRALRRLRVNYPGKRGEVGITQRELSVLVGMHRKRISDYERGKYAFVLPGTASKFAMALTPNADDPARVRATYRQLTGTDSEEAQPA